MGSTAAHESSRCRASGSSHSRYCCQPHAPKCRIIDDAKRVFQNELDEVKKNYTDLKKTVTDLKKSVTDLKKSNAEMKKENAEMKKEDKTNKKSIADCQKSLKVTQQEMSELKQRQVNRMMMIRDWTYMQYSAMRK